MQQAKTHSVDEVDSIAKDFAAGTSPAGATQAAIEARHVLQNWPALLDAAVRGLVSLPDAIAAAKADAAGWP